MPPGKRSASAVTGSRFGVDVGSAVLRDGAVEPSPEFHIPVLSGTARPWDLADWQIATPEGFAADLAAAGRRSPAKLMARTRTAEGLTSIDSDGGWKLSLDLKDVIVEGGAEIQVSSARATVNVPPRPPRDHTEPTMVSCGRCEPDKIAARDRAVR